MIKNYFYLQAGEVVAVGRVDGDDRSRWFALDGWTTQRTQGYELFQNRSTHISILLANLGKTIHSLERTSETEREEFKRC